MNEPEQRTAAYRRGYYEGYLRGVRVALGLGEHDPIPTDSTDIVLVASRLHIDACGNRLDTTGIEAPPTMGVSVPIPMERKHLPEALDPPRHWTAKFDE